jgi:hypothetical protein
LFGRVGIKTLALTGLLLSWLYSWVGICVDAVQDHASWECLAPGWIQVQRCAQPWFLEQVQAGALKPRDIQIWFFLVGATEIRSAEARLVPAELARDLGYGDASHINRSAKRLQAAGALKIVDRGRFMPSPHLVRAGGPGRHRMWFAKWHELQAERQALLPQPA